ncbi:MAG: hypothetical protein HC892_00135 [Saprospiraceae bacterium]|nr:hypothetical protein [Saprospiraceae bacterium]
MAKHEHPVQSQLQSGFNTIINHKHLWDGMSLQNAAMLWSEKNQNQIILQFEEGAVVIYLLPNGKWRAVGSLNEHTMAAKALVDGLSFLKEDTQWITL